MIDHAALREFATDAIWVAKLEEVLEEVDCAHRYFNDVNTADPDSLTKDGFGVSGRNLESGESDGLDLRSDLRTNCFQLTLRTQIEPWSPA